MQSVDPDGIIPRTRVRVHNLSVRRNGIHAIRNVSLNLGGGVVAVAGPNGSGKSTLLRAMATLLPYDEGTIAVMGSKLDTARGRAEARRALGFLPQEPAFLGQFSVVEAVEYSAWLHETRVSDRSAAVRRALAELDLLEVAGRRLSELSGGLRQRAYIAQVLVHRPPVLLLDEPTVGLDAEHRVELRRMIARISEDRLVVLSTHLTEDIELLADEVVVLRGGRVVFDDAPTVLAQLGRDTHMADERPIERALRDLDTSQ